MIDGVIWWRFICIVYLPCSLCNFPLAFARNSFFCLSGDCAFGEFTHYLLGLCEILF